MGAFGKLAPLVLAGVAALLPATALSGVVTHTVTPVAASNGTIAPTTPQVVNDNTTATFTITPSAGYSATSVAGTCPAGAFSPPGSTTYVTGPITADCTVQPVFATATYTVTSSSYTASGPGPGGTITPASQTVTHGSTATFTVTLNPGYYYGIADGCSQGGGSFNSGPPITYTTAPITGPCNVQAVFMLQTRSTNLSNLSTRLQVGTGNDVAIGGFVLGNSPVIGGSTIKRVAIVATGPSLAQYGIANPLANPTLTLVRESDHAVIATNDDWQTNANAAQISAAGYAPSNPLESALLMDLAPGAYTAIVQGVGGGTGAGVVAVYDVGASQFALRNIATRGKVLTGNDVMIGGIVIGGPQGSGPQKVAIVATGPSLAQYGITNPLPNPTITIVRSSDQAVIATNDDWQTDANAAQLQAAGFAPSNPLESGLLIDLQAGAYTVIVSGVGGGTGVAVISVYDAIP